MDATRLPKSVQRIVVLSQDPSGTVVPVTIYSKSDRRKTKRGMRILRPFETATRQLTDATMQYAQSYGDRHRNSNRKKRDGWLRDLNVNVSRAASKGSKRLKLNRVLFP